MVKDLKYSINLFLMIAGFVQIFGDQHFLDNRIMYIVALTNNLIL
jgi:hypothetical protein